MPQIRDNLSKNEIAEIITNKIGLSTSYNKKIINDLIEVLIISLNNSKNLKISNFGSFYLKKKSKRIGRNPKNKQVYEISERNVITFYCSEEFSKKINNNG